MTPRNIARKIVAMILLARHRRTCPLWSEPHAHRHRIGWLGTFTIHHAVPARLTEGDSR